MAKPPGIRLLKLVLWTVFGAVSLLIAAWAAAALYIDVRVSWLRFPLAGTYLLAILTLWIRRGNWWFKPALTCLAFGAVLAWWFTLRPSNDRDWQPDVAVLPYVEMNGTKVTVHHIRNCEYRTEGDFDVRHYDQSFDLEQLRTADIFFVYWGSPNIAHTMVSFGFAGGEYLCFSIETRKEKGESYSALRGFFRQFELTYVVGDERDLVRLRTNYRQGEDAYLYRLQVSRERVRALLVQYLGRMNSLRTQPEWYSAATQNCTTSIRTQRAADERSPWDWRMLLNGRGDELLYERGLIATNLPFAELKARCHINPRAQAGGQAAQFSERIRKGLPGIPL